ncbi:uncharacterized protein EI97DRAFT_451388 [Westerdykella ornata]|uniref:Uncharacterized protein n=1 Tax=Westerdykella ornata TaxID=318751 RepID=A0A6A6JGX2_WESOR|nr:uncharacterized protein EI97DRAFT_451388 [Westerdykella ornata]KAF2274876.1 hypothetical protein EI97DRAFT_451388 [Westerdykella ornata]
MRPESASLMARQPAIIAHVEKRQIVEGIIPTYYTVDGPTSGTVVGIVLGSVLGFLLLIWLFYSIANINNTPGNNAIAGVEEEIVVRRPRKSHSGHSRRSTRTEVREYSRSPRREHIIVEERRQPRPPRPRSIVVEERRSRSRVPGDDIVEVIEEHEDYRERRGSRR